MIPTLNDGYFAYSTNISMLPLDVDGVNHFAKQYDALIDLAQHSAIVLPTNIATTDEEIRTQACTLISSLLDSIIATPQNETNANILNKCLEILKIAGENAGQPLSSLFNDQLVILLASDNYLEHRAAICQVLIKGQLTDEQSAKLNKLVVSSDAISSNFIIELLLAKGTISLDTLDNIIKSIKASKVSNTDSSVAKEQLLLIAQSFNRNSILKEKLQYPILDFFKSHNDSPLLLELVKTIDNPKFFDPISNEIKSKLQCLEKLLEIERAVSNLKKQGASNYSLALENVKQLLDRPDIIITEYSADFISKSCGINIQNKSWSLKEWSQALSDTRLWLKRILQCKIPINRELIDCYGNYLTELLHSSEILDRPYFTKAYPSILIFNLDICVTLLKQGYTISGKCLEVLIQCLDKHLINNTNHIGNISEILAKLASQNKMPVLGINISITLINSLTNKLNQKSINNIVGVFESLAGFKIQNNDLTDAICEKYLGQSLVTARILQALDIIATNTSLLPGKAASSLVDFIQNTDNIVALRIRAIELLSKIPGTVKEDDISKLSKLLQGEKKSITTTSTGFNDVEVVLPLSDDINFNQFTLEYLKLDKYVRSHGMQLKDVPDDGNCFFHAVAEQLTSLGHDKDAVEIRALAIKELINHQERYREFIIGGTDSEQYAQFINSNMMDGVWVDDVMIQATSNALNINIKIYRFDNTINDKNTVDTVADTPLINIGYTGNHYLSLIRDTGEEEIILEDSKLVTNEPNTISSETMDYRIALAATKLLTSYAAKHGSLTTASLNYLEQALNNAILAADSLTALAVVAEQDPNLLNPKLLDYIKECDPQIHQQISFNASLDLLDELLKQNDLKLIKEQLNNLTELLRRDNIHHIGKLYQIISKALIAKPTLFTEYLLLVKLSTPLGKNIEIINKLIKFEQITYQDLCWFINKGCYSEELHNATEKYFNSNIDKLRENQGDLGEMLESLRSLVGMKGDLALDTINNLVNLAKALPHQAVNIIRIIYLINAPLDDHHFSLLEQLFTTSNKQLTLLLSNLWAKANRQLTSTESVATVFGYLEPKTPLEILPTEQLKNEAKILLQLQISEQLVDKLSLLTSLQGRELQAATINTILQLIKIKDLSKGCIKVLASLASPPYLDEEVSEIICKSQDGLDNEYLKLKPFLSGDVELFLLTDKQKNLKKLIEARFPHVHLTNSELKKLEANLDINTDSLEFMEDILLGDILEKASSIEEYSSFLELINKYKISQQEIVSNLGQPSLAVIIDVIETKILYELLKGLENFGVDDELVRINHFCYQLKSNGWSSSSLIEILQHINASNIKFFVNSLKTIYEYKITAEQRNKKGETTTDITGKYTGGELEIAIFSIVSNQFEHKLENKGEVLLKKVVDLNPNLAEKAIEYQDTLQRVHNLYSSSDNGLAIENWTAEQVKDWAIKFKANSSEQNNRPLAEFASAEEFKGVTERRTASYSSVREDSSAGATNKLPAEVASCKRSIIPKDDIATIIAILQRANNLHTEREGKAGHLLRDTQIISLLLLLDYESINNQGETKGKLLQIATGEGKSTISAILASILALHGEKVDLITSSSVLSTIGYEGAKDFFERLGLSVGINIVKPGCTGQKACYSCDIVYGDALSFQADFLSNTSFQGERRGDRDFAVAIVDEVDSMLVDSSNHIAKQTTPIPLMEYLLPILTIAWDNFQKVILPMTTPPMNLEESFATEKAQEIIERIINGSLVPKHLKDYAMFQAGKWAASLARAINLQLDKDYVINIHEDGYKVINPVDNSTGVTQENMVWQDGLHQFLQIKHNCRISPEGLTTFFITNIAYFLKYNKVLGMTGTLGSDSSQEFLKAIYGVELAFVPTYKDKQVIELPAISEPTLEALRETVCDSSYQEAVLHNRAVLIVCENIKDADYLCQALKDKCGNKAKTINYSRSEEKLYNSDIEQLVQPGTIIVATNLAGRGTDIRTSGEVEANGGLHVISTFIAKNARDEAQVKGRTSRQGNSGSYQIIAYVPDYDDYQAFGVSDEEIINIKKQQRDSQESQQISYNIEQRIPCLLADDTLYQKFTTSYLEFAGDRGERTAHDPKIKQFIEDFGLWFKTHKADGSIESFIASSKGKYQAGTYSNPSYAVLQHFGISSPWTVLVALSKATSIDDIYNFPAHYYAAKCWLDIGPKDEKNYKNKAIESLMEAGNRLSEILSYLTAMSVSVANTTGSDNELLQQITTKIGFFKTFLEHIQSAIKLISESGKEEVRVKGHINKETLAPKLHKSDILEIDFLGISGVFELETYKPRQNWQDTILVAVCAIAQMAVGVLITVGTLGGGITLAAGIFTEGLMDAYKVAMSVHKGESINLESYFLGKAISYAIIGAQVGFNKLAPATTTARTAGTAGTTGAATTVGTAGTTEVLKDISTSQLITKLAETAGIQFAKTIAIEQACNWVSEGIRENALDGLEERIASNVGNAASQALSNNSILLTANCNIERNQIMTEIQKAIFQATKTSQHAMIINQLATGIAGAAANSFKGSSSGIGLGNAVKVTHAAVTVVDVIAKIDPIIDNIKDAITTIINQAGTRAKERLGNKVAVDGNQVLSNDLSRNIGEMAANSMLSLLQRKVTPTLNLGVSYVADQMVGKYQKEQTNLLEKYSQQFIANKKETTLRDMTSSNTMPSKPPPLLPPHKMSSSSTMSSLLSQGYHLAPQPESTGLTGLTSSDLALASLLPKPGSGDRGGNSILLLSSAMQQPIYVFENGKFLQSYGKGLGGTPITIGYDSKNQQYFGFTNKGSSNSGSIYDAISASSNGKYSADILRGVVQPIPVADTTPPKPPSQLTPQPKPLSQSELSAAQFLVDTLTADKQQLQAKENEYHRNILQIAKQNMYDSAAKKFARDEALMQQAYAIGGEMGLDYDPRAKKFIEENLGTALALAAAPYVGMGVGLLGRIGAAARLLPTIAAEGGGGSSIIGVSQLANVGSRLLMTDATAVGARIGSTAATATPINPLYTAVNATTAAATLHYSLKAIEDTNNLLGYSPTNTDRPVPQQSQATAPQPVKVWDVNKPLPTNINPCAIIDLDANKPIILTTPIPSEKPITILSTPDHRDILQKLSTLPGFSPVLPEFAGGLVESFPVYEQNWQDLILYKDSTDSHLNADRQFIKEAEKLKLDRNNPTDHKILENLDTSVEEFIAKNRKAKIFREFPGEWISKVEDRKIEPLVIREVLEAARNKENISAVKARKLLKDNRFLK